MFAVRTGISTGIGQTPKRRRGSRRGSLRHKRYKKERKKYRCWLPFMVRPCVAGFAGIFVICAGVAMCTVGYYSDYFSLSVVSNSTDIWLDVNETQNFYVNETQSYYLSKLTYFGPMIMAIGCFMIVVSCVLVLETRDRYIRDRIEEKEEARRMGVYEEPPKQKDFMERLVNQVKKCTNDCRGHSETKVGVIKATKPLQQSLVCRSPVNKADSSSTLRASSECVMYHLPHPMDDHSEDSSSRLSDNRPPRSCSVLIHQQGESLGESASQEDVMENVYPEDGNESEEVSDDVFFDEMCPLRQDQEIERSDMNLRNDDKSTFTNTANRSKQCLERTAWDSTDAKESVHNDLPITDTASDDYVYIDMLPKHCQPDTKGNRNLSFVIDYEDIELNHNNKFLDVSIADNEEMHKVVAGGFIEGTDDPLHSGYFNDDKSNSLGACKPDVRRSNPFLQLVTDEKSS